MTENTHTTATAIAGPGDVWYRGDATSTAGPHAVIVETGDGEPIGLLAHVSRHSPTGMSWGYGGSGPADLARSLLIAVLGDGAKCPVCEGTRMVIYDPAVDREVPYRANTDLDEEAYSCACENGYRPLPYQAFKRECVARWGDSWRISRTEILAWLAAQDGGE
jgi:hypothetical protein